MSDVIDLTDVYTYTGYVHIGNSGVWGPYLRTLFSDGSEMRSRIYVSTVIDKRVEGGEFVRRIIRRYFSVESTSGNGRPQQKYEVILTLLDQEGREAGAQYQTRFESGRYNTGLFVDEPAVARLRGDSGHLRYRVEIRSLEKKLAKASDTDAEKKNGVEASAY